MTLTTRLLRSGAGAAVAALLGVPVALWIWWTNARAEPFAACVLSFDLWLVLLLLLLLPVLVADALLRTRATVRNDALAGACVLYALLWFIRMERAHQPLSIEPHISVGGLFALTAIVIVTAAVFAIGLRRSLVVALAASVLLGGLLEGVARWQRPPRRRDDTMAALSARFAQRAPSNPNAGSRRVLFIGIDGMEWRAVDALLRAHRLPTVEALLRNGRFYQLDNREMRTSPEIWSAIHTGVDGPKHGIDSYLRWHFVWMRTPVVVLPKFGFHSVWYLDRMLLKLRRLHLWWPEPVTNRHLVATPDWAILSQSGKRVIAIQPMPVLLAPERVAGSFVTDDGVLIREFSDKGTANYEVPGYPSSLSGFVRRNMALTAVHEKLLRKERYDVGIVYASFLDGAQHLGWKFRYQDGCVLCGDSDPQAAFSEEFARSRVADAYVEADRTIAAMIEAFGRDATVILASDHGWDYEDYEHFARPYGMLIVANAGATGYGGVASVLNVAPTILAEARVPPSVAMTAPVDAVVPAAPPRHYSARREFLAPVARADEKLRELRALGYIGR